MEEELFKIAKEIDNFSKKYNCRLDIEVYEQNYIDTGKIYYKYVLRAVIPEQVKQVSTD